jgi:hypothetical protein
MLYCVFVINSSHSLLMLGLKVHVCVCLLTHLCSDFVSPLATDMWAQETLAAACVASRKMLLL